MITPEQKARQEIDKQLQAANWVVQDFKKANLHAHIGVAIREFPTDKGEADYALFVEGKLVGIIEAKEANKAESLSVVEEQTVRYAKADFKWKKDGKFVPLLYESTGTITRFTNLRDPKPRAREVFNFHSPETLTIFFEEDKPLRERLFDIPKLNTEGLRECQTNAIINLEESFKANRPRALIWMATGAGKTFTAINTIYRLLNHAEAKRILFLVDTKNLGTQAEMEFKAFNIKERNKKFTEDYEVQLLRSSNISPSSQVCISTIQRMYSILRGEELDEKEEETSLNEIKVTEKPPIAYNPKIPIETFDFIVVDECHRSIYNLWRQVLEYFDAFIIGLTATPDDRTFGFFKKNVVSEYRYEQSVVDGVNVPYDVFPILTKITKQGAQIEKGQFIDQRHRLTRAKWLEQIDETLDYHGKQLDRDVVNPDQILTIIKTFREKLFTELFPNRKEVPKTLIFAKSDSHAEDIIRIVREEFGESNDFCRKITYTAEKPSETLNSFRNGYYPRIAVTVDMIATGTDVKPLECLIFMRDVRSRSYFEQMKGRGTRSMLYEDLRKTTPSVTTNKTHFVIVDAVGVCLSDKSDSRPLERKPSLSLKDLMQNVVFGSRDEATLTTLANRLTRIEKQIEPKEREKFTVLAKGKTINNVVRELLNVYNPDVKEQIRLEVRQAEPYASEAVLEKKVEKKIEQLANTATAVFQNPDYRELVLGIHTKYNQIVDTINLDEVLTAGWSENIKTDAGKLITDFKTYLESKQNDIIALQIFYNEPYRRKELTFKMISSLLEIIKRERPTLAPVRVWAAYEHLQKAQGKSPRSELVTLVSLIRCVLGDDAVLTNFSDIVDRRFQAWTFKKQAGALKFSEEQMTWLRLIKEQISHAFHIEVEDLERTPFRERGGAMRMYEIFKDDMMPIISELNIELAA